MKKNIESFVQKVRHQKDGSMSGGFGSIKGGASLKPPKPNSACSNLDCSGTNINGCTNSWWCPSTANSGGCSNQGTCFA